MTINGRYKTSKYRCCLTNIDGSSHMFFHMFIVEEDHEFKVYSTMIPRPRFPCVITWCYGAETSAEQRRLIPDLTLAFSVRKNVIANLRSAKKVLSFCWLVDIPYFQTKRKIHGFCVHIFLLKKTDGLNFHHPPSPRKPDGCGSPFARPGAGHPWSA